MNYWRSPRKICYAVTPASNLIFRFVALICIQESLTIISDNEVSTLRVHFESSVFRASHTLRDQTYPPPKAPNGEEDYLTYHSAVDEIDLQAIVDLLSTGNDHLHSFFGSLRISRHLRSLPNLRISKSLSRIERKTSKTSNHRQAQCLYSSHVRLICQCVVQYMENILLPVPRQEEY